MSEKDGKKVSPWISLICPNCGGPLLHFGNADWDDLVCTRNTNVVQKANGEWIMQVRVFTEDDFMCFAADN
jgi:hypothetical protein